MKIRKISYPPINIGTSLMLVIFLVLCMVIFAALSFSSALRDHNNSIKTAERTTLYYEANNLAEEKLAEIDAVLQNSKTRHLSSHELMQTLQDIGQISLSSSDSSDQLTLKYAIAIDEDEILQVVLQITPDQAKTYSIQTWQQILTSEWNGDETISVLGNE